MLWKAQVLIGDRSRSKSHTGLLKRVTWGKGGWVPSQRIDLGASVEPGDPQLLGHPASQGCWL